MSNRLTKKVLRKSKQKYEPSLDFASRSSTPDSSASEASNQFFQLPRSFPLIVDDSELPDPSLRPRSALDKVIDSLDYDSFVIFANVRNRPPGMRASDASDNASRLRLCVHGMQCTRQEDDCPFTHVTFERNTWNPEEDELYAEVASVSPSGPSPPPSPRSPSSLSVSPPSPVISPSRLIPSGSRSPPTSAQFPDYGGSYSNFSYSGRPPPYSASGFMMGPPYQGGGFTSSGLYTGPSSPIRTQWVHGMEDDKDVSRPPAHLMSRELSKLSLRDKRKVKSKQQQPKRATPSPPSVSPPSLGLSRWSVPHGPVDLNMSALGLGRQFEMQAGLLVQV